MLLGAAGDRGGDGQGSLFGAVLAIGGGLAYLVFMIYVGRPLLCRLSSDVDAPSR